MTRFDPTQDICCDKCGHTENFEMNYTYNDYSGNSGQYREPTDDGLERGGWKVDEDKHFCENCREEEDDDEDNGE